MSEPWPPAFIRTAPPIDPGTPTAHSKPVRPRAAHCRARTGNGTDDPARTTARSTSISNRSVSAVADTTIPGNPASATNTLEPRPRISTGSPDASTGRADRSQILERPTGRTAPRRHRPGRSSAARSARRVRRVAEDLGRRSTATRGRSGLGPGRVSSCVGHRAPRWEMLRCRRIPSRCTRRPGAPRSTRTERDLPAAGARRGAARDGPRRRRSPATCR